MNTASQILDVNSPDVILAFFTALFGSISSIALGIITLHRTKGAKNAAVEAKDEAVQAKENTINVSNGFVGRMDRKLDRIDRKQDRIESALREHLEWHLNKEASKQ